MTIASIALEENNLYSVNESLIYDYFFSRNEAMFHIFLLDVKGETST